MVANGLAASAHLHADLPGLRLPVPLHRRRRRALVPQPRRAARGRGARGDLPDAAPVGARRARRGPGRAGASPSGPRMELYAERGPAPDPAAARVRARGALAPAAPRAPLRRRAHRLVPLLLAARRRGRAPRSAGFRLVVDWHEVWSRDYWLEYLGPRRRADRQRGAGALPARPPARVLLLAAARARGCVRGRLRGEVDHARGRVRRAARAARAASRPSRWSCSPAATSPRSACPRVVPAIAAARERLAGAALRHLRRRPRARASAGARRASTGSTRRRRVPGLRRRRARSKRTLRRAVCMVLPSRREGYGMVVIEAAAGGHAERGRQRATTTRPPS